MASAVGIHIISIAIAGGKIGIKKREGTLHGEITGGCAIFWIVGHRIVIITGRRHIHKRVVKADILVNSLKQARQLAVKPDVAVFKFIAEISVTHIFIRLGGIREVQHLYGVASAAHLQVFQIRYGNIRNLGVDHWRRQIHAIDTSVGRGERMLELIHAFLVRKTRITRNRHRRLPLHGVEPRCDGVAVVALGQLIGHFSIVGGSGPFPGVVINPECRRPCMTGHYYCLLRVGGD